MDKISSKLCKNCRHYADGGLCRNPENKKGYTSALDSNRPCFEAPDTDTPDSVFAQQPTQATIVTKQCKVCGKVLPLSEFPSHPKSKDGHTSTCKECHEASVKAGLATSPKNQERERKAHIKSLELQPGQVEPGKLEDLKEELARANKTIIEQRKLISELATERDAAIANFRNLQKSTPKPGKDIIELSIEDIAAELRRRNWLGTLTHEETIKI